MRERREGEVRERERGEGGREGEEGSKGLQQKLPLQ